VSLHSARQVLFLDYDNCIHRSDVYRTTNGLVHGDSRGALFEYAPLLEQLLAPFPQVQIVLSTSWVREVGFDRARDAIPQAGLRARVVGSTYDPRILTASNFLALQRGTQILQYVKRQRLYMWLAIDDRRDGFESCTDRLIHCQPGVGLGDRDVQALAARRLQGMFNAKGLL